MIDVNDLKLGRTYWKEAGEAAFRGDMFFVTFVSSEVCLCALCLVLL